MPAASRSRTTAVKWSRLGRSSESQSSGASATNPASRLQSSRPERVGVQAAAAVVAQRCLERCVVRHQCGAIPGAIRRAAKRVHLQMDAGDAERFIEVPGDLDDLRVERRRAFPDALDADLRELVLPSRLGPFGAEERPGIVHADGADLLVEVCAEHGAERAGRPLRTERQRAPATVVEREHLLLDDVRVGPYAAAEQLRRLDDRGFDPPVSEGFGHSAVGVEQPSPGGKLVGKDVTRAFRRCDLRHWRSSVRADGCGALSGLGFGGAIGEMAGVHGVCKEEGWYELRREVMHRPESAIASLRERSWTGSAIPVQRGNRHQDR